jgi:hypothetical protein
MRLRKHVWVAQFAYSESAPEPRAGWPVGLAGRALARMLGNGLCTRPVQLDCRMESACETCSYFQTTIEFRPTLQRQHDHAQEHGQPERAAIFDKLIQRVDRMTLDKDHPYNGGCARGVAARLGNAS